MRADKHLQKCSETSCKYSPHGICCFGLRDVCGCYLDEQVKKATDEILLELKELTELNYIAERTIDTQD